MDPHGVRTYSRKNDRRISATLDSSTWEMTSGRRQKDREDLLFLYDRDADECNRADLEALFRVS